MPLLFPSCTWLANINAKRHTLTTRYHNLLDLQPISQHTLEVSFINDAIKSQFGKCIIKFDQDFAGYYWNSLAMYQMYDCKGELLIAEVFLSEIPVSSALPLAQAVGHPEM